jgi:AAA ATPase domain
MTAVQAVAEYYDAWRTRRGDLSGVPLAEDFRFVGRWPASRRPRAFARWPARRGRPSRASRFVASWWMAIPLAPEDGALPGRHVSYKRPVRTADACDAAPVTVLISPVLVGRQEERGALARAFARATAGEPAIVLAGGEAGVGKSRLVEEAAASGFAC